VLPPYDVESTPSLPEFDEDIEILCERIQKMVGKVTCPTLTNRLYPAIKTLLDQDEERKIEYQKRPCSSNESHIDSPKDRRKFRIINAIFLPTQRIGCTPSINKPEYGSKERDITI
jgi:hypothetical protein